MTGSTIKAKIERLYLFHGTIYEVMENVPIAEVVLHYEDGPAHRFPIEYGRHVRDGWAWDSKSMRAEGSVIAWRGQNEMTKASDADGIRLGRTTLENPEPKVKVRSIDLVSTMTRSAPFFIGITVE